MNGHHLRWLYGELPGLLDAGVLTPDAAARLRAHYGEAKPVSRSGIALVMFATLGAALIGSGVILVIAHNWDMFSRPVRVAIALAPLLVGQGIGAWVLLRRAHSVAWCEGVTLFIGAGIGASIAIVGQVYHLPANLSAFYLTWILLFIPLVYLFNSTTGAIFYLVGVLVWAGNVQFGLSTHSVLGFWPLTLLILPHAFFAWRANPGGVRANLLARALVLYFTIGIGLVLERAQPGLWMVIYTAYFAILLLLAPAWPARGVRNPFLWFGCGGLLIIALILSFDSPWRDLVRDRAYRDGAFATWAVLQDNLLGVLAPALALLLAWRNCARDWIYNAFALALPALTVVAFAVALFTQTDVLPIVLMNLYLFVSGVGLLYTGFQRGALAMANYGLLSIALLAVFRFFDADLPILFRGLAFILVGVFFLVTNLYLVRREARA